jgi:hypothetical protein
LNNHPSERGLPHPAVSPAPKEIRMKNTPGSHDKDRKQGKFGAPIPQPGGKHADTSQPNAAPAKSGGKSTGKLPTPTHPPA